MAAEDNSRIIAQLYKSKDDKEIIRLLEDVEEIGDPVFLEPLVALYETHIKESFSHYFLTALGEIKSSETGPHLQRLLKKVSVEKPGNVAWVLSAMESHNYFPSEAGEIAKMHIHYYSDEVIREKLSLTEIDLRYTLSYLEKSGKIKEIRDLLRALLSSTLERGDKLTAVRFLIKIDPKDEFARFIRIFEAEIKDTDVEIILAKELANWGGGNADTLRDLIFENGSRRAKEIISQQKEKEEREEKKRERMAQQEESIVYNNAKIMTEIGALRRSINLKTLASPNFKFKLIPDNDLLIQQIESANDEGGLNNACTGLRSIVQDFDSEISNHGYSDEDVSKLLPNTTSQEQKKTLNQLYLYFTRRNIPIDSNLYGLRKLNRILTLFGAHPENEKEFAEMLQKNGLATAFRDGDWSKLHSQILIMYKEALIKIEGVIT